MLVLLKTPRALFASYRTTKRDWVFCSPGGFLPRSHPWALASLVGEQWRCWWSWWCWCRCRMNRRWRSRCWWSQVAFSFVVGWWIVVIFDVDDRDVDVDKLVLRLSHLPIFINDETSQNPQWIVSRIVLVYVKHKNTIDSRHCGSHFYHIR